MSWKIDCKNCKKETWADNIVTLIDQNTNDEGWFICSHCKKLGFIEKKFKLQEPGEIWEPYLRGVYRLGVKGDTYQPFVFLVSYEPDGKADDIWFSYYKDLRSSGGRLKLGYGPGGPPVLGAEQVINLIQHLLKNKLIEKEQIKEIIKA